MRFEVVEAIGVGPLRDQELRLAPGLNVIHGVNEAGKSSWHAALIAGWLGLRRGPGRRSEDRQFLERFTPWDGSPFVAAVQLVTDDGLRYRFRHNLTDLTDHEVTDGANAVVTGQFEHDGTADGARLLGLTRDIARSTLCVSQADVLAVTEAADGLQTQLQQAAASANRGGGTAAAALDRLEDFRRQHVGLDRANATRPLRRAMDQLRDAQQALVTAEGEHEQHLQLIARRDRTRDRRHGLQRECDQLRRAVRAAELQVQRLELDELHELHRRVLEGEQLPPSASDEECSEVERVRQRFAERPEPAPKSGEVAQLETALAELPHPPEGDTEVDALVADAHEQLGVVRGRLDYHRQQRPGPPPTPDLGGFSPAELERHAATLETPVPEAVEAPEASTDARAHTPAAGMVLLGAAGLLALAGAAALVAGEVLVGLVALGAAVVAGVAGGHRQAGRRGSDEDSSRAMAVELARQADQEQVRARHQQAHRTLQAAGITAEDPAGLRTLADQAREAERQQQLLTRWQADEDHERAAVESATHRLHATLRQRSVAVTDDVDAAYERYRQACRQRAQQAAAAARRGDLEARLEAARQLETGRREQNETRATAERQLFEHARRLGHDGDDLEAADAFLAGWRAQQRELAEQHRAVERARAELELRLEGTTLDEVSAEVQRLALEVADTSPVDDLEVARGELADLDQQLETAREDETKLGWQIANAESQMTPVAAVRERAERAEAELSRVEGLRDVLEATRGYLEDASRRVNQDIAPVLRQAVTAYLPAITRHRYDDVQVDPGQLQVSVRTDGGVYRPAQHLSRGTSEQVYLLLRLGLAEHLVVTDEAAPLLLDDVTVQFDEHRTRAFLDLCLELAEHRQIVLFTQEREALEWAEARLSGPADQLHRLPDPALLRPTDH